jgi:hypothetical protein
MKKIKVIQKSSESGFRHFFIRHGPSSNLKELTAILTALTPGTLSGKPKRGNTDTIRNEPSPLSLVREGKEG